MGLIIFIKNCFEVFFRLWLLQYLRLDYYVKYIWYKGIEQLIVLMLYYFIFEDEVIVGYYGMQVENENGVFFFFFVFIMYGFIKVKLVNKCLRQLF